jgi:hypothetical protein
MTLRDVDAFISEEFPTSAKFARWVRPVYCDGLTLTNITTKNEPDYIRLIQVSWKGDAVGAISFDYDLRKWSEGRRFIAFRIWKEIEKFNA